MTEKIEPDKVFSIREIRELIDLSLDELSIASGVSKSNLYSIENYNRNVSFDSAEKLADAIQTILRTAMRFGDDERSSDSKINQFSENWREPIGEFKELKSDKKIIIYPEMLIASHTASVYEPEVQEMAYQLLIEKEIIKLKLKFLKSQGRFYSENDTEINAMSKAFRQLPSDIISSFLADKFYERALWGTLDEFRDDINRMGGYFLSNKNEE